MTRGLPPPRVPTRRASERGRTLGVMYVPLALLFPCAVPTALPTIFYLEHGHEHVPAEAHGSLRGAKVEKVAAVPPSQLADTLVGFPPGHVATKWDEMGRGFRELARLVSHLEALRQASASLPPDANPTQPEAIGMIMDRPSFAFEKYWGSGANFRLADWIAAAPLDWQVLQLSLVPAHGQWAAVDALPLELPPTAAWQRWVGTAGLHCYVFRASFARYMTRAFYRNGKWLVLGSLRNEQGQVDLGRFAAMGSETFLFSRAVAFSALASPLTFARPRRHDLAAEHTHAGVRAPHELCVRALYEARWRAWLSAWEAGGRAGGARGGRGGGGGGGGGGGRRNRTLFRSRAALGAVLGAARAGSASEAAHVRGQPDSATALSEACAEHEKGWQARDEETQTLLRTLNSSLGGGRLRLRGGRELRFLGRPRFARRLARHRAA